MRSAACPRWRSPLSGSPSESPLTPNSVDSSLTWIYIKSKAIWSRFSDTLWEGRYGPYVKHGDVNASLPKGVSPEDFTLEAAVPLLAERALVARPKKGRGRGASASKSTRTAKTASKTASGKPKSKTASAAKTRTTKRPAAPNKK